MGPAICVSQEQRWKPNHLCLEYRSVSQNCRVFWVRYRQKQHARSIACMHVTVLVVPSCSAGPSTALLSTWVAEKYSTLNSGQPQTSFKASNRPFEPGINSLHETCTSATGGNLIQWREVKSDSSAAHLPLPVSLWEHAFTVRPSCCEPLL